MTFRLLARVLFHGTLMIIACSFIFALAPSVGAYTQSDTVFASVLVNFDVTENGVERAITDNMFLLDHYWHYPLYYPLKIRHVFLLFSSDVFMTL